MENHIISALSKIEEDYQVKILFACEAGSRALGFASKCSDYDVRFIYIHKQEWYLSIDQFKDVIETSKYSGAQLDISGWELTKALRLFRKSNPSLLEWLNSRKIYCNQSRLQETLVSIQNRVFSEKAFISHHLNLAKRNFTEIDKKEKGRIKTYLYIIRSIMSVKWIKLYQQVPPVDFRELLPIIPNNEIKRGCLGLLKMKQDGDYDLGKTSMILDEFIKQEISEQESYVEQLTGDVEDPTAILNQLFRDTLKEAWQQG